MVGGIGAYRTRVNHIYANKPSRHSGAENGRKTSRQKIAGRVKSISSCGRYIMTCVSVHYEDRLRTGSNSRHRYRSQKSSTKSVASCSPGGYRATATSGVGEFDEFEHARDSQRSVRPGRRGALSLNRRPLVSPHYTADIGPKLIRNMIARANHRRGRSAKLSRFITSPHIFIYIMTLYIDNILY